MIVDQDVPSTALCQESQRLLAEQPATHLRSATPSLLIRIGPPRSFCCQWSGRGSPAGGMPSGALPPPPPLRPVPAGPVMFVPGPTHPHPGGTLEQDPPNVPPAGPLSGRRAPSASPQLGRLPTTRAPATAALDINYANSLDRYDTVRLSCSHPGGNIMIKAYTWCRDKLYHGIDEHVHYHRRFPSHGHWRTRTRGYGGHAASRLPRDKLQPPLDCQETSCSRLSTAKRQATADSRLPRDKLRPPLDCQETSYSRLSTAKRQATAASRLSQARGLFCWTAWATT